MDDEELKMKEAILRVEQQWDVDAKKDIQSIRTPIVGGGIFGPLRMKTYTLYREDYDEVMRNLGEAFCKLDKISKPSALLVGAKTMLVLTTGTPFGPTLPHSPVSAFCVTNIVVDPDMLPTGARFLKANAESVEAFMRAEVENVHD